MNRIVIHFGLTVTCAAMVWCVYVQNQHLASLRAQEQRLLAQVPGSNNSGAPEPAPPSASPSETKAVSPELLKLRSAYTRLQMQKRELSSVLAEHERLQQRLAQRAETPGNTTERNFTIADARFVGYNSPEDTVQSSFWALQNHDFTNMLQAFTPELAARIIRDTPPQSRDEFMRARASIITNVTIVDRTPMPDGSIELSILSPENNPPEKTRFYLINGQWKIGEPPR